MNTKSALAKSVSNSGRKASPASVRDSESQPRKALSKESQKAKQGQSSDAKSPKPEFYEVLEACVAECEQQINQTQKCLDKIGPASGGRKEYEKLIEKCESLLRSIGERRQQYERYQAKETIPIELRKEIARVETEILRNQFDGEYEDLLGTKMRLQALFVQVERIENPLRTRNAAFKVGKWYSRTQLEKAYDSHVEDVLGTYLSIPDIRGYREVASHKVLAHLPEKLEYRQLRERYYGTTLRDLTEDAYLNVLELQNQVQIQHEGMEYDCDDDDEEEHSQVDDYDYLVEVDGGLQRMFDERPVLPTCVSSLPIVFRRLGHLADQERKDAVAIMRAVSHAIEAYRESGAKITEADAEALTQCCQRLNGHADEIEGIELPW